MVIIETASGTISISPEVFTNIAGDAATRCFGVKGMAGKAKESGIYQLLRRESMSKGVFVSFNEDNTASIDLHIVVEHGINLATVGESIIREVTYKVTEATGIGVKEVNVYIDNMMIG